MNFFERQRQVRKLSRRLVLLFILAVLAIVLVVDLAVVFVTRGQPLEAVLTAVGVVSVVTMALIGICSLVRMLLLRSGGGGKVARQLGGVYVPEDTADPQLRRLRNVVEEMAIASGVGVPEVYVLPEEDAINAFAAGWSPADAAVAVTRGALERLNRDELQGVIAHEFSHVVNGDMRLNIRLIGVLFGILALAVVGRFLLYGSGGRKNNGAILLIALALMIAGYVGVLFGRLIKAAVSRQREYLADASAVQYTRQTSGLTGALKKIGGLSDGSKLRNGKVEDVSHMLFGDGLKLSSMFATHPPLPERIKVLDPTFNPEELEALSQRWSDAPPNGLAEDHAMGLTPMRERTAAHTGAVPPGGRQGGGPGGIQPPHPGAAPGQPSGHVRVRPDEVVASVATPAAGAYRRAGVILDSIPEPFLARARRPDTVVPLVFGLLMSSHPQARQQQHAMLSSRHGRGLADAAWTDANALAHLQPALRLPLAEVAFSALRRRPQPELQQVTGSVEALIQADGRTDVFEYCLSRLLHRELHEVVHRSAPWGDKRRSLASSKEAVTTLLSTLARIGHRDPQQAQMAYHAGASQVMSVPVPGFAPPPQGVVGLEPVWPALDGLPEADKQRLVAGMVTVISHDGVMTVEEVELLRTVCAVLHCPLPPLSEAA
ncbi:MAG: M48 family metalloprotease [Micromonosporaceae bacterium]